ncbi:MAG: GNAT family N-acetyltransferase [Actinomycetota bacterium]
MTHVVRGLEPGDPDAVRSLIDAEGWNRGLQDVDTFTATDPDAWFVAEADSRVVGMVLATRWSDGFGWIGLYLVDPEYRGRGIGVDLFGHALARLEPGVVGLDGDPAQQANYRRSGFRDVHGITRWRGPASAWRRPPADPTLALADPRELAFDALVAMDARTVGAPRPALLRAWLDQPEARLAAATRADDLVGFAIARPARHGWKVAPVLADDAVVAEAVVAAVVRGLPDDAVCWLDVPDPNAASQALTRAHGFEPAPTSGRMVRGRSGPDPDVTTLFAILAHEVG